MTTHSVTAPKRTAHDSSRDLLWSEQRLRWRSRRLDSRRWKRLADLMVKSHFAEVRRASGGLIRSRRRGALTDCTFFGAGSALRFERTAIEVNDYEVVVTLTIAGGSLARRSREYGVLILGVNRRRVDDTTDEFEFWERVEAFPSVFLTPISFPPLKPVASLVARVYRWYHTAVCFRYLDRLRVYLDR